MICISVEKAEQAYTILVQHAGAPNDENERYAFVHHVTSEMHRCREYRFGGLLGWGGKFRNNGNNDNVPYVDCYQEHLNGDRARIIGETNAALRELFARVESI
jgi:hypothetical protein